VRWRGERGGEEMSYNTVVESDVGVSEMMVVDPRKQILI